LAFQQVISEVRGGSDADKKSCDSISSRHPGRQPTSAPALQQPRALEFIKAGKASNGRTNITLEGKRIVAVSAFQQWLKNL
jgi:hypothetical protein